MLGFVAQVKILGGLTDASLDPLRSKIDGLDVNATDLVCLIRKRAGRHPILFSGGSPTDPGPIGRCREASLKRCRSAAA
ncbi:hypothetical protein CLCR_11109 [Cladophialophora carrionii]|uniref:Uncharacterized protein n=1 Tax=Cladophialophora carrionii TaxID=86049 RepID=A0A1C1CYF2_9EURO|nr:hypothetical protein CLCR_11109 [Cladophialophora carrionii]